MTITCLRPGCAGAIDGDGFCDLCGRRHTAGAESPVATGVPGSGPATLPGAPDVVACARGACTGAIVDGYCDVCGLAPSTRADPGVSSSDTGTVNWAPRSGSGSASRAVPTGPGGSRGNLGAGLTEVPALPASDPLDAVLVNPEVPERKRMCARCDEPVGRSRGDLPGRTEGFCTHCGAAFSFTPKLRRGDLVGGQYQVEGCIAHGGMGWVYLARDRNVSDKWVVLKGLLDSEDASARAAADAERRFLAEIEHPNIVKIFNFVQYGGAGYIVMEYVGGLSLREIRNRHREEQDSPLPVPQAIAYMLEILPAFGFLHHRGMLYCDFKPDNAIQVEEQVKLIDLGGVRAIDDEESDLYGTIGYQAPEVAQMGASVASDLYTVARTLAVLALDIPGFQDPRRYATSLPPVAEVPAFQRYESFHQFLVRATAEDPAARFASADEMADQLRGVLRQVVALDGGNPAPAPSVRFSAELGQGAPDEGWRYLPVPTVDRFDPIAGLLASAAGAGPDQAITLLRSAPASTERSYQLAHAHLEAGELDAAARELDAVEAADRGWRTAWWRGVLLLASGRFRDAPPYFTGVAAELPGELAPRLAAALAWELVARADAEAADDASAGFALHEATRLYGLVAQTDPSYSSACFGLSRVLGALGDRDGAMAALQRIPPSASSHQSAQLAAVRLCATPIGGHAPGVDALAAGSVLLTRLDVEPSVRLPLVRDLLEEAVRQVVDGSTRPTSDVLVAGVPLIGTDLRLALEATYRSLAKMAATADERRRLVDRANDARPRTRT